MAVDAQGYDDAIFTALKNLLKENPRGVASLPVTLDDSGAPVISSGRLPGTWQKAVMLPLLPANTTGAATQLYSDATGCYGFCVQPTAVPDANATSFIVGWSYTAADYAAVIARLTLYAASLATPDGAFYTNVAQVIPATATTGPWTIDGGPNWIGWDEDNSNTIKTIVLCSQGAADNNDAVNLIVLDA